MAPQIIPRKWTVGHRCMWASIPYSVRECVTSSHPANTLPRLWGNTWTLCCPFGLLVTSADRAAVPPFLPAYGFCRHDRTGARSAEAIRRLASTTRPFCIWLPQMELLYSISGLLMASADRATVPPQYTSFKTTPMRNWLEHVGTELPPRRTSENKMLQMHSNVEQAKKIMLKNTSTN